MAFQGVPHRTSRVVPPHELLGEPSLRVRTNAKMNARKPSLTSCCTERSTTYRASRASPMLVARL